MDRINVSELIKNTLDGVSCPTSALRYLGKEATYIVYYTWSNNAYVFADGKPLMMRANSTISIYSPTEDFELQEDVISRLKNADFYVDNVHSVYNDETGRLQTIIEVIYLYGK